MRIKAIFQSLINLNGEKIVQESSIAVSEEIKDSRIHPEIESLDPFIELVRNFHIADNCVDNLKEKLRDIAIHLHNCEKCRSSKDANKRRKRPRLNELFSDGEEMFSSPGIGLIDLSDIESDYSQDSGTECPSTIENHEKVNTAAALHKVSRRE